MNELDPRLQALIDKQEIYEVLMRYCRGIDRSDIELIRSVYHEGAIDDHGMFLGTGYDFAPFVVDAMKEQTLSMHLLGNVSIDLQGDVAFTEAYALGINGDATHQHTAMVRYIDRFEKRNGEWKIAHRVVAYDSSRRDPRGYDFMSEYGAAVTRGGKAPDDITYHRKGN